MCMGDNGPKGTHFCLWLDSGVIEVVDTNMYSGILLNFNLQEIH